MALNPDGTPQFKLRQAVKIETPCAGHPPKWLPPAIAKAWEEFERRVINEIYTERCVHDSLKRGEAPYSSQLIYDRRNVLDDAAPDDRATGMRAGLAWTAKADLIAVYADHGVSSGMQEAMRFARARGIPVQMRYILAPANGNGTGAADVDAEISE